METLLGKHWHALDHGDVTRCLETNLTDGLDRFEVAIKRVAATTESKYR